MLISSTRHRPEDLAIWNDLEEADLIHGRSERVAGLIRISLEAIRDFAAEPGLKCYASVSWGKDSVALAELIRIAGVSVPLVHLLVTPHGNPENPAVRDAYLAMGAATYHEIKVDCRDVPPVDDAGLDRAREKQRDKRFFAAFPSDMRHYSGVRADESWGRKVRMRHWGLRSPHACAPLGWWSAADVFGFLAARNLPVHPNYAMLGGGRWGRGQIRVDVLGASAGNQFGRREWELEYYGDELRRIEAAGRGNTAARPSGRD